MKKKKSIFVIIAILMIISAIVVAVIMREIKQKEQELLKIAETTEEQRILWNDFFVSNSYLSQIEDISDIVYISDTDLIKLAITSDNVEIERIVTEEIEKNDLLSLGDGYKKSKENINKYLKNIFGKENIEYNFVDTYAERYNYLLIENEYVYFTKIEVPEKIYIAVRYKEKNTNYEVQIYEYDVTEANKEILTDMIKTGNINESIEIANRYIITGQVENNNIKIITKTTLQSK